MLVRAEALSVDIEGLSRELQSPAKAAAEFEVPVVILFVPSSVVEVNQPSITKSSSTPKFEACLTG